MTMKKLLNLIQVIVLLILIQTNLSYSQTTITTGTIISPDGFAFAGGTVIAVLTPFTGQISCNQFFVNGIPMGGGGTPCIVSGVMDVTGKFTINLTDDHKIQPTGSLWNISVCSPASVPCSTTLYDVFGSTIDLSTQINNNITPIIGASTNLPKYYQDSEVTGGIGSAYFNLNDSSIHICAAVANGCIQWQPAGLGALVTVPNTWSAAQTFTADIIMSPPGGPNINFNRLITTTSNHPTTGGSVLFGPNDSVVYGCVSCNSGLTRTGVTSNGVVNMNLAKGNGSSGPTQLCDYLGCQLGFGVAGSQSLGSSQSANSDLVGELSFSAATTASYTWINSYTNHPECMVKAQFDTSAGNYSWVTYTGTSSFTINWHSSITGSVSYICIYRN